MARAPRAAALYRVTRPPPTVSPSPGTVPAPLCARPRGRVRYL